MRHRASVAAIVVAVTGAGVASTTFALANATLQLELPGRDASTAPRLIGAYTGTGTWHDDTGKTMTYSVSQTARLTASGFAVQFTHDFADKTQVRADFEMVWRTHALFDVTIDRTVVGHGYCFENTCGYHLNTAPSFVEVSYQKSDTGLDVYGSSSANADGHYIAWHEVLRRVN